AIQGSGNTFSGSIHIENTAEGRQTQIQAIENLLAAINKYRSKDEADVSKSVRSLENAKVELAEKQPDPKRVIGWLETAKYGLKGLGLVKEVKDAAVAAYLAFQLLF